jgi:hypothetical protein
MSRFILRFRGVGKKPSEQVQRIKNISSVRIIDETSRMVLVDVPESELQNLQEILPEWNVAAERTDYSIPEPPVPKIKAAG